MVPPIFLLVSSLVMVSSHQPKSRIPSFIRICRRSDPALDECVKNSVERIRPYLTNGIPELGIPPCEPLRVPEIVMNQGRGAVVVQSKYSNIKLYGPTQFVLRSVRLEPESDRVTIKLWLPKLQMVADYSIKGKILMLPIRGNGLIQGNYTNIEATAVMEGERVRKNGEEYFNVVDFTVSFSVGGASIRLSRLFDGDPQLGEAMNKFLNDNWRHVVQDVQPVLEKTIGDLFKKFSNRLYHKFPLDQLLPP